MLNLLVILESDHGLNSILSFFTQLSGLSAEESQLASLSGYRSNNSKFFVKGPASTLETFSESPGNPLE